MPSLSPLEVVVLALGLFALFVWAPARRRAQRRGTGFIAQYQFRQDHLEELDRLFGSDDVTPDPRPRSPWTHFLLDGRVARMVLVRLPQGTIQAGVELAAWDIPVQVNFTDGSRDEIEHPASIAESDVLELARELGALGVDNVAGEPHILRLQVATLAELPARLEAIAPVLVRLEQLAPAAAAPDDPAGEPTPG